MHRQKGKEVIKRVPLPLPLLLFLPQWRSLLLQSGAKVRKPKFKEIHIKDTYWVENDIYQTIADMTKGNKGAKALIFNQALKDYLKKNKIEIIPFVDKDKKNK